MKRLSLWLILAFVFSSCNLPATSVATPTPSPLPPSTRTPQAIATHTLPTPALNATPLAWFAPLPPLPVVPGRPFTGSDDFMDLFEPNAPWQKASTQVQVFKLYGEWVGYASAANLQRAIQEIQSRGMALAMEFGPLDAEDCGQGIEGFSGVGYAVSAAKRIKAAGGTLNILAMDEPYFYAHIYDGIQACHWSAEKIAQEVDQFVQAMRAVFPEIVVGDTEALAGTVTAQQYNEWLKTFREVNGYDLAFLHLDVDWGRPNWADEVGSIVGYGDLVRVPIGIIYMGNAFDASDEAWLSAAGERVKKLEIAKNTHPDHVLFQSWNDKPDHTLPESSDYTFTNFINTYFADKTALGFKREGKGANLALGKPVHVSGVLEKNTGDLAVDGDLGTLWNSGGGPTQWIEIDLGADYSVQKIALTVSQYPAGQTIHRLLGKGASGSFVELTQWKGNTTDGQVLIFQPPAPLQKIRFIRIETVASPSWVSWREIEVIDAGN